VTDLSVRKNWVICLSDSRLTLVTGIQSMISEADRKRNEKIDFVELQCNRPGHEADATRDGG
jgi:hypothetical protein